MRRKRAIRVALTFAAAVLFLWSVAITDTRQRAPTPSAAVNTVANAQMADAPPDGGGIVRLFESTLAFVQGITRSFERRDDSGVVVRLLIIVEVLIGALGFASCVTVWGKGKADLVYRIVDVMGALFLVIALLIFGMTAI